ncbi:hypothetical protein SOCE26_017690 [Sorangium cellulosum]|uniref:VWFA domain-containing protein n=1 Tax=Sorangium cellulosum TaxID=56 RepID=A0A2L0EM52_SORCE|nr:hypothetical protein [Sorangium cellulosum]AUX40369.1 hypothetical protein SOCE26_017690 [Sorangium cellulosum]
MSTSYTFRVLDADGSVFGKGCFTYDGPPGDVDIAHLLGGAEGSRGPKLTAFWYHDSVVGTLSLKSLLSFNFTQGEQASPRFAINAWNVPESTHGLTAGTASPGQLGVTSAHRGNGGELSCQGRKLEFPKLAEATTVVEEGQTVIPVVDLVVVIDSSSSMKDEAETLSKVIGTAIDSAKTKCPSNLRAAYLGIEGTFSKTVFTTTVRNYLTQTAKADASLLKGRTRAQVTDEQRKQSGDVEEDAARAIEDIATHFDWRPGAVRNIFFLGDEPVEGGLSVTPGGQDQGDIEAANRAIEVARQTGTRVHMYMGTGKFSSDAAKHERIHKAIEAEYARVARETDGQFFASQDNLSAFQAMLEKVICGSKTDPRVTTTEFCCCQEYVEQLGETAVPR